MMNNRELVSSRQAFNTLVYTPLSKIESEIKDRAKDKKLNAYIGSELVDVPQCFSVPRAVLSRSVATYNYEMIRFLDIVKDLDTLTPLVWEYHKDTFTPNVNKLKHNIGKLTIEKRSKNQVAKQTIVDFNVANGKKFSDLRTVWGDNFIDFHHSTFPNKIDLHDATDWYKAHGAAVEKYYKKKLILFLRHGVMFENFLLKDTSENPFITDIFLPAFQEIERETGHKPLITVLEHPEDEGLDHWMHYEEKILTLVKDKLSLLK